MSIKIYVKYVKNNRDFHTTKLNLPTGALDSKTGRIVMDIFHELNEKQKDHSPYYPFHGAGEGDR